MNRTLPILLFCFLAALMPPAVLSQDGGMNGTVGIVTAPMANVHAEPASKSRLETQVLLGDEVRIEEKRATRYRITIPNQGNRQGWVQQEALQVPKDQGRGWLNSQRPWIVIAVPKTEALILDRTGNHKVALYAGTRLPVLEQPGQGKGYKVLFPDRSHAIIPAGDVQPVKSSDPLANDTTPQDIAKTARQFQGVRQLTGGMTAQGMDTAGLISICYRVHTITASTDRAWLRTAGERVAKKDLEPGDIVVFTGEGLGLMVGEGRFLQAQKKSSIQPAGIHDRRYAGALQYGVRLIGADRTAHERPAEMTADEILLSQARAARLPLGRRIAYWASRFVGTPYDPDPLGLYVRTKRIVADEKVDCMYHTFRSVELARSMTPGEAVDRALALRFRTQGRLVDGIVQNYEDRFEYGEDMVLSGKWGRNITVDLGQTVVIPGSRGKETVEVLPKTTLLSKALQAKLQDGDIVYWVKDPKKRFVRLNAKKPFVIHAAGDKDRPDRPGGGVVKELPFADYVRNMRFIGAFVTRFEQEAANGK